MALGAQAQSGCPASGTELVLIGAGKGPGGPPTAGGGPSAPAAAAGDQPPQGIYTACLDEKTGKLTLIGLQAKVARISWVTVDPKKAVIYTTGGATTNMRDPGTIFSFKVDRTAGTVTPLGSALSGGTDPTNLAWDARSGTLFVANHGEGVVGILKTDADGGTRALTDMAQQEGSGPSPRQKNAEAHGVAVDPTGRFVICTDFGADKIYVYKFDGATGKLSPSSPAFIATPAGSGPRHVTFTPDGKFVILDTEMNGQVRVYRWDEKAGTLGQPQIVDPYPADYNDPRSAAEIQISPDGRFFYLSLRGKENKMVVYKWDGSDGTMTEIQRVATGGTPWSFSIDATGKWLLVTNNDIGTVPVFSVDKSTGKLTPAGDPLKLPGAMTLGFLAR
jgi:6-phosphogluconolactonase